MSSPSTFLHVCSCSSHWHCYFYQLKNFNILTFDSLREGHTTSSPWTRIHLCLCPIRSHCYFCYLNELKILTFDPLTVGRTKYSLWTLLYICPFRTRWLFAAIWNILAFSVYSKWLIWPFDPLMTFDPDTKKYTYTSCPRKMLTPFTRGFPGDNIFLCTLFWYIGQAKICSFYLLFIPFQSDVQNKSYAVSKMKVKKRVVRFTWNTLEKYL